METLTPSPSLFSSASPPGPTSITFVGRLGKPSPQGSADRTQGREAGGPGARSRPGEPSRVSGSILSLGKAPPPVMLGFCAEAERAQAAPPHPMQSSPSPQGGGQKRPWAVSRPGAFCLEVETA